MTRSSAQINALLAEFGRHTPHILRKQLLCHLLHEYLGVESAAGTPKSAGSASPSSDRKFPGVQHEIKPSFQRFHGTILFVDISGFTALSLKLNVEELKKHINEYFTMMLDIVDKHGGEVIKFAGDAIYIIWQTPLPKDLMGYDVDVATMSLLTSKYFSHDRQHINQHKNSPYMKNCLEKAVMCGLEISAVCSNHRVILDPTLNADSSFKLTTPKGSKLLPGWNFLREKVLPVSDENDTSIEDMPAAMRTVPSPSPKSSAAPLNESNVTYLNVHSGISNGLMAGIDVGANDRWEFLLIGKPLARVANAESQAGTGQLVLCPFSHDLLHPPRPAPTSPSRGSGPTTALKRGMSTTNLHHVQHIAHGARAEVATAGSANIHTASPTAADSSDGASTPSAAAGGSGVANAALVGHAAADGSQLCACGCTRTPKGFFIVPARSDIRSGVDQTKLKRLRNINTNLQDLVLVANENIKIGAKIVQLVESALSDIFAATKSEFHKTAMMILSKEEFHRNIPALCQAYNATTKEELVENILGQQQFMAHLTKFMHSCLLDDIASHVHDVARNEFYPDPFYRHGTFEQYLATRLKQAMNSSRLDASLDPLSLTMESTAESVLDFELGATMTSSPPSSPMNSTAGSYAMSPKAARLLGLTSPAVRDNRAMSSGQLTSLLEESTNNFEESDNFDETLPTRAVKKNRKNSTHSTHSSQGSLATMIRKSSTKRMSSNEKVEMTAELRSVIVMFIKIDSIQMNLWVDSSADGANKIVYSPNTMNFDFLPKTPKERRADELLLSRLQKCMQVVTSALAKNGGQLRQFIVDDKGTVAIGTFGLKGANVAVNDDNAAAAIECARMIVSNLGSFNIASSIGVTSGQGFCGLVGSLARHEYAIMGPSTNLSARLMSKAQSGQIMCDIELKKRDRTHNFEFISEIIAKGYTNKVSTFTPIFHEGAMDMDIDKIDSILGDMSGFPSLPPIDVSRVSFGADNASHSGDSDENDALRTTSADAASNSGGSNSFHEAAAEFGKDGHPLVRILTNSEFHFRSKGSGGASDVSNKSQSGKGSFQQQQQVLHGRQDEIQQILTFLFPTLRAAAKTIYASVTLRPSGVNASGLGGGSSVRDTRRSGKYAAVFHYNIKPRFLTISAAEGLGKSALVASIGGKLHWLSKQSANFNIALFRNRPAIFLQNVPFLSWKPILQEMLYRAKFESILALNLNADSDVADIFDEGGTQWTISDLSQGLAKLWALLPPQLQNFRPLLSAVGIIDDEPDNEHTACLTNQVKLALTADLISALIQQYPIVTKCSVLIIMEQIQWLDSSSLLVLHKIWSRGSGIAILSTIRPTSSQQQHTADGNDVTSPHGSSESNAPSRMKRNSINGRMSSKVANNASQFSMSLNIDDPLRMFRHSERFKLLELANLDEISTKALISDALKSHGIELDDDAVDHIFDITGGNLLYTYEVTRSLQEKNIQSMSKDQIAETIAALRCNRVEEVIYHRFDQLNSASQYLIKTASVAGANGSGFNFALLLHVMGSGGSNSSGSSSASAADNSSDGLMGKAEDLVMALYEILRRGEFLTICEEADDRSVSTFKRPVENAAFMPENSILRRSVHRLDNMDLTKCSFEFAVRLEQLTIYGMLLDDQKEYLHERVASYYYNASLLDSNSNLSSTVLCEEGFHWQKSCAWAAAMSCFLRASEQLRAIGDVHIQRRHLLTAFTMFRNMCRDAGFSNDCRLNLDKLAKLIAESSGADDAPFVVGETDGRPKRHRSSSSAKAVAVAVAAESDFLTIESIYQIFGGDSDDLNFGLKVHIRLAQLNLLLYENYSFTSKVLDDALQILLQSKNPYILNSKHFMRSLFAAGPIAESSSFIEDAAVRESEGDIAHENRKRSTTGKLFCLSNYSAYCFPIMSAYIQLNSWSPRCSSDQSARALLLCEEALDLAALEETNIFTIQLRCQEITLHLNRGNLGEAAASFRLLSTLYISSKHHNKLIALFGTDCVVHTMCAIIQYLLMHGDFHRAVHVTDQQMNLLARIKHSESLVAAVIPLCTSLSIMCCPSTALEVCNQHYGMLMNLSNEADDPSSLDSFSIFYEWLCRRLKYERISDGNSSKKQPQFLKEEFSEIDFLLKQPMLLELTSASSAKSQRPLATVQRPDSPLLPQSQQQSQQHLRWSTPIDDFLLLSGLTSHSLCAEMCLLKLSEMLLHLPPTAPELVAEQQSDIQLYSTSMDLFISQSERKVMAGSTPPLIYTLNIAFMKVRKHLILRKLKNRDYKTKNTTGLSRRFASIDDAEAEVDQRMLITLALDPVTEEPEFAPQSPVNAATTATVATTTDVTTAAGVVDSNVDIAADSDAVTTAADAAKDIEAVDVGASTAAVFTFGGNSFDTNDNPGSRRSSADLNSDSRLNFLHSARRTSSNDSDSVAIATATAATRAATVAAEESVWQLLVECEELAKEKKLVFALLCVGNAMKALNSSVECVKRGERNMAKAEQLMKQLLGKNYERYLTKITLIAASLTECL